MLGIIKSEIFYLYASLFFVRLQWLAMLFNAVGECNWEVFFPSTVTYTHMCVFSPSVKEKRTR